MDKRKLLIFVMILFGLALIFSGGMGSASAASGDTIYVNGSSGNDDWDGQSAVYTSGTTGPKLSIKNATGAVNANGTVKIADGLYTGINNTLITINKNMNIAGQSQDNTIIDGQQSGQSIFTIISGINVTIINLTLTNNSAINGGAISNSGTLTVLNSTLTKNTGTNGGAISNSGTLTVTNSTIKNNSATTHGGGIDITGIILVL